MSMVNVKNLGFGGTGIPDALPKAIAELQNVKFAVVTGAAASTLVPVIGMDPEDHIGAVVNLTDLADVPLSQVNIGGRNAAATIICLATAAEGDFVTVNGRKYTIKDVIVNPSYNAPPGIIPVDVTPSGTDVEKLAAALAKVIMSGDSSLTASVVLGAGSPPKFDTVSVKVRQAGTAGNAFTLAETGNSFTVSGATFTGGLSAANQGFTSTVSLAGKKLLVVWYDKNPGLSAMPLLLDVLDQAGATGELAITSLDPPSAKIGDPSFTLRVLGTGFGPDSVIKIAGNEEPTTFVSPNELTTGWNMPLWTNPDPGIKVQVFTGLGDMSNEMLFDIQVAGAGTMSAQSADTPNLKLPKGNNTKK